MSSTPSGYSTFTPMDYYNPPRRPSFMLGEKVIFDPAPWNGPLRTIYWGTIVEYNPYTKLYRVDIEASAKSVMGRAETDPITRKRYVMARWLVERYIPPRYGLPREKYMKAFRGPPVTGEEYRLEF